MPEHYSNLWWAIDGVLAGMGMPWLDPLRRLNCGGALDAFPDDLPVLHALGIRAIVCLLNLPGDAAIFQDAGFEFKCIPVADGHPPSLAQAAEFVEFARNCRLRNLPLAIFCEAGIGRTGTMIASYFISQGETAAQAIAHVRQAEPSAVETVRQIRFLEEFANRNSNAI